MRTELRSYRFQQERDLIPTAFRNGSQLICLRGSLHPWRSSVQSLALQDFGKPALPVRAHWLAQLGVSHSLEPHTLLRNRWFNSETATVPQRTFGTCKEHAFTHLDHLKTRTQAVEKKIDLKLCVPQIPHHQLYFSQSSRHAEELQLPPKHSGLTPFPARCQHPPAPANPVPPSELITLLKSVTDEKNRLVSPTGTNTGGNAEGCLDNAHRHCHPVRTMRLGARELLSLSSPPCGSFASGPARTKHKV